MEKKIDFIGGLKEMFKSTRNLKLLIGMILVVFLVFFMLFGGCSNCGCGGCSGNDDVAEPAAEETAKTGGCAGCGGCGSSDGSSDGGSRAEKLFEGSEVSFTDIDDSYYCVGGDYNVRVYYPADSFTVTDPWVSWIGDRAIACDDFAIQLECDYYSKCYKEDGTGCSSADEFIQWASSDEQYDKVITLGDKTYYFEMGMGLGYYYFPLDDSHYGAFVVVPKDYDPNTSGYTARGMDVAFCDEAKAIIANAKVTTTLEEIPDGSEKDGITFAVYKDSNLMVDGNTWQPVPEGVQRFDVGQVIEKGDFVLKIVSVDLSDAGDGDERADINIEFTNNSENTVSLYEVCSVEGFQYASCDSTGCILSGYTPIKPGQTAMVTDSSILNEAGESVRARITFFDDNGDGTYTYNSDNEQIYDLVNREE